MIAVQLDRLQAQLLTSGLSQRNQPLYQVIHELIKAVRQGFNEIEGDIVAITTPSGGSGAGTAVIGDMPLWREPEEGDSDTGPLIVGPRGIAGPMGPPGPPNLDCSGCVDWDATPPLVSALSIGSGILSGTIGSVLFIGAGHKIAQDNSNFFWDDTNNRLGLGTSTPGGRLDIAGTFSVDQAFGMRVDVNHDTATAGTVYGAQYNTRMAHTAGTQNAIQALFVQTYYRGTSAAAPAVSGMVGTISRLAISTPIAGGNVSGTISTGTCFEIDVISNQAGGAPAVTFTTVRGLIVRDLGSGTGVGGLTIVTAFGIGIAEQNAGTNSTNLLVGTLSPVGGSWNIYSPSTRTSYFAGQFVIGPTATVPTGSNFIAFGDGTAPGSASNIASVFGEDVSGTVHLFAMGETGASEQLTGLAIRKTADETVTNSTTPQADNHLTVNLLASSSYYFRFVIHHTTASANAGIKVQLNGTVGVSNLNADVYLFDHGGNVHFDIAQITALAAANGANSTGANGVVIEGSIETTTAGTFLLEWAQNTADAVNGTVVQEGSTLILRKLNA